jgi:hypothetical protein
MTTTAGAAFPAVWATFSTCEGAVCCPVRLIFRFLRCLGTELTRLLAPGFARLLGMVCRSPGRTVRHSSAGCQPPVADRSETEH